MNINELLREEIQDELSHLEDVQSGTEEYKVAVDGVSKLTDRLIELEKLDIEREEKVENRNFEQDYKLKQMAEDKKDRKIKNGIAIAGIVLPLCVTIWGVLKSFEFEKDGTITTIMGRGFISKLIPKK